VEELFGDARRTSGISTAAPAAATSAMVAAFVRYHGGGGALKVNVLLEGRS
jgi:hypothetical protein